MTSEAPLELFGAPVGLFTGKVRSYLRKQGIAYVERLPSDRTFRKEILPRIHRFMNPVIRTADGTIVQDTTDIIDFLEASGRSRRSAYPVTPKQKLVALTLDLYGGEGLIRPAMHYRWSYRPEQEAFLRHEFGLSFRAAGLAQEEIDARLEAFMGYLGEYLPSLGITPDTRAAIETSYGDMLRHLDAHFRVHPYALGGRPTVADFGLFAPLYAHLARDPVPATKMKLEAPSLYRWTERMNSWDDDMPEFPSTPRDLPQGDEVPETLLPVLAQIAEDYLPELRALVEATGRWLNAHPEIRPGDPATGSSGDRWFTTGTFHLRGLAITSVFQSYTLFMLQRVTDAFEALSAADSASVETLFRGVGLDPLLRLRAPRRVERRDFLEVWGEAA